MTHRDIAALLHFAHGCREQGLTNANIWTPVGWKAPKGFPRRELMCCPTQGGNTWQVSVPRLIAWLEKHA